MTAKTKRRYGPAPLDKSQRLGKRVNVFFTEADYLRLVEKAGGSPLSVPAYIRAVALRGKAAALPAVIPEANHEVWVATAGLANNLNQLTRKFGAMGIDHTELAAVRDLVRELRNALIGIKRK
ncbi:plasmid mobilization protein [Klebsiella pneumoniae]|uniref:plasmid mobilization protein n=1 Tax=Klebsiella pneumoniae TaxID=573 RepID=UPI0032D9D29E